MSRKSRGFTLIELLVVVAIIALLLSILLPSLSKVREQNKTMICATHMRQIGQAVFEFASQHGGRGPGGGSVDQQAIDPSKPIYTQGTSSLAWNDVIDTEVLQRGTYGTGARISSGNSVTSLSCPNFVEGTSTSYARQMCYNEDAAGGTPVSWNDASLWVGQYGQSVNPASFTIGGKNVYGNPVTIYALGAKMDLFRPDQFLLIESYAGNDVTYGAQGNNAQGQLTGTIDDFPDYNATNAGGDYGPSFRHPFKKGANFLLIDGTVKTLGPKDNCADPSTSYKSGVVVGPTHMRMANR